MIKNFIDYYRSKINPPYSTDKIPALLSTILITILIPLYGNIIGQNNTMRSLAVSNVSATNSTTNQVDYYGNNLNTFGLLGQTNFMSTTRNNISGSNQEHAPGIVVDKSSTPNRIYVVDSGNSRILGYNGIGTCSNNNASSCTIDSDCGSGNTCNVPKETINPKQADIIIGQPNPTSGACNGDNNLGWNKAPTASTLCLLAYPWGNNTAEQWQANNIDVDSSGNLYVTDTFNNRVLEYYQPFSEDKTGGKGDSVADFVWGQNDFTSNGRNRGSNNGWTGISPPDNHSLWLQGLGPACYGNGNPAVSVDSSGNVWVSDNCNHRILRFPANNPNADLVIGEPDFVTNTGNCNGNMMDKLCGTVQARVNPANGELYVLEKYTTKAFISRILVYAPPFTNGMSAYKTIIPQAGNFVDWGGWDGTGNYMFQGSGFTFNPDLTNYPNGVLWITEHDAHRVLLIDGNGTVIKTINAVDASHRGGTIPSGCPFYYYNGNGMGYGLNWPSSSVSFDSANNIYITAEEFSTSSHIVRFSLPYDTFVNGSGTTCLPLPNGGINWVAPVSANTIEGGLGLAVYGNQLMSLHYQSGQQVYNVGHGGKMMIWNDYQNKPFGAAADYVAARQPSFEMNGAQISNAIDNLGRLWYAPGELHVFQLPFTNNSPNVLASGKKLYWADDQTQIQNTWITGVAFDSINNKLYLVDRNNGSRARILRVSNYTDPTANLLVDMVIGQTNKTNTACNQGLSTPNAGTLCDVKQIKFDKLGNLYAVDNDYECHGNRRITMFSANDLQNATGMFPNLQASKVFNEPDFSSKLNCAYWVKDAPGSPVSIAFDSNNHMVVGNDGYYKQENDNERELKQLWFYADPVNKQTPDASIKLYMGTPGEMTFDTQDNLILQDATWHRIEMINLCSDPQLLEYLPGVNPVNTCSGITPTPTIPTPTLTLSPTPTIAIPSITLSPTNSPTPTRTPTPTQAADTISPSVSITNPLNNAVVPKNSNLTIAATVTDNISVANAKFYVNGNLKCTDTAGPYNCVWKVPGAKNVNYTILVQGTDPSGNVGSATITVRSSN